MQPVQFPGHSVKVTHHHYQLQVQWLSGLCIMCVSWLLKTSAGSTGHKEEPTGHVAGQPGGSPPYRDNQWWVEQKTRGWTEETALFAIKNSQFQTYGLWVNILSQAQRMQPTKPTNQKWSRAGLLGRWVGSIATFQYPCQFAMVQVSSENVVWSFTNSGILSISKHKMELTTNEAQT